MQILKGTKREITMIEWQEQLEKYMKRANDSMECFRLYHGADDLIHLTSSISSFHILKDEFWQNWQLKLHPTVPYERTFVPGRK